MNCGVVDVDHIVSLTPKFTPADIEHLFQIVAQYAFEEECERGANTPVTTGMIAEKIASFRPSLTESMIAEFREDVAIYSRV